MSLFSELEGFSVTLVCFNPGKQSHCRYFTLFVVNSALLSCTSGFREHLCTIINLG